MTSLTTADFDASTAPWLLTSTHADTFLTLPRAVRHSLVMEAVQQPHTIVSRIGSESFAAAAYDVSLQNGARMVAKMMPNCSSSDAEDRDELVRAEMMSQLVSQGVCPSFSMTYGGRTAVVTALPVTPPVCHTAQGEEVDVDRDIGLIGRHAACRELCISVLAMHPEVSAEGKAELLQRRDRLLRWTLSNRCELPHLFDFLLPYTTSPTVISETVTACLARTTHFPSTLLFSEMAHVDLGTLLQEGVAGRLPRVLADAAHQLCTSPRVFKTMCAQIFAALKAMQEYAGMVHNDLHWRNVLVTFADDGSLMPLIHDFGASRVQAAPSAVCERVRALMGELSEVKEASVRPSFSSSERVADVTNLMKQLLQFAEKPRNHVHPDVAVFLTSVLHAIAEYTRLKRTDGSLFHELIFLSTE